MNVHEIRRYRMLTRVHDFGARYRGVFAPVALAKQLFASVDDAIAAVDGHARSQSSSRLDAREQTIAKAIARETLLERLRAVRRTVRACAPDARSVDSRFALPRGARDRLLVAAARAFAEAAAPLEHELIAHAMPPTCIKDLTTAIDDFEQAMHERHVATGTHVGARVGIEIAVAKGFAAVRRLDAIVANHLHDSPGLLLVWQRARRVERSRPFSLRRVLRRDQLTCGRVVAPVAVPEGQTVAAAQDRRTVPEETGKQLQQVPRRMRSHLAA